MAKPDPNKATPVVLLHPKAHEQIEHYVDIAPGEVSWVGLVELCRVGGRLTAYVAEIAFLKQWCTGTGTHIDPKMLDAWMKEKGWTGAETPLNIYWGHSHGPMLPYWSQTDEECIESFLYFMGTGLLASVVYNKKGEWEARVDVNVGSKENTEQFTLKAEMEVQGVDYETREECEKQVKELVTEGRMPKRDLTDERLAAIEGEETVSRTERDPWRHHSPYGGDDNKWRTPSIYDPTTKTWVPVKHEVIYAGMGDGEDEAVVRGLLGARQTELDKEWRGFTYCPICPAKENCARPVIHKGHTGCSDRKDLVVVTGLNKHHWKQAQMFGTQKELQSWRDRRMSKLGARGEGGKMCIGASCTRRIMREDVTHWTMGRCEECCKEVGMEFGGEAGGGLE